MIAGKSEGSAGPQSDRLLSVVLVDLAILEIGRTIHQD